MPPTEKSTPKPHSVTFNILLGAILLTFIQTFALLSPILLSLLLVFFISLAVNPIISWMRTQTGGRKVPTGLLAVVMIIVLGFIMASRMKLHPLAVIFSMLLCIAAFGVLGVLIAAPLVAVVTILHDELYRKRYLPTVTDAELDYLAGIALHEKVSDVNVRK